MRILVVASAYPSAEHPSFGIFVRRSADALAAAGHDVDRAVLETRARGRAATPLKYGLLTARAARSALLRRPDVIWAHFLVPPGSIARLVGRLRHVPYVVTAHGTDVANAESSERLRAASEQVVNGAAAVIAVSEALAERLRALYGPLDGKLHVVSAGVDTSAFHDGDRDVAAAAVGWMVDSPRLVCVGNLVPVKNHQRLLAAFARVQPRTGGSLAIVGAGPLERELRARADELGIGAAVRFAGEVPESDVPRWLRGADAACLVSEREGFGLAALEALACGRPVVLSRTAGAAPLVEDGVTGVMCDPLDVDSIAAALEAAPALRPGAVAEAVAAPYALGRESRRVAAILAAASERP